MNNDKKLYDLQDKIIENVKKNYKDYKCYKVDEIYSSEGLLNEHGYVVAPPYSVALTSQDRPDLLGVTEYPDVKIDVCNGKLNDVDINTKIVFEEYYAKKVENVENYKHIVTQKFKSYDESSDRHLQGKFRLYVDDFASFSKVVSKEDFEKQCLDGTLFDNEINAFLYNSFVEEHKDLILCTNSSSFKS